MTKDELSMVGFEIVAYSGDARSTLLELLKEIFSIFNEQGSFYEKENNKYDYSISLCRMCSWGNAGSR